MRSDPATRNATAQSNLEAAITYWTANVASLEARESYALDIITWGAVLQRLVTRADALVAYRKAKCELWQVLYSNWQEICDSVSEAEQAAAARRAEAEERAVWEQRHAFIGSVHDRWNEANDTINALGDQWNAITDSERIPSQRLAAIAQQQVAANRELLAFLRGLSSDSALSNATVTSWWRAVIAYWERSLEYREVLESRALGRVGRSDVEQASDRRDAARAAYDRASCDLWRLQDYVQADEVCAEAGR